MGLKRGKGSGRFSVGSAVIKALLLDILLIAVGLVVFSLFHHVLPGAGILVINEKTASEIDPEIAGDLAGLNLRGETAAPKASETPMPTPVPTATATPVSTLMPTAVPTLMPTLIPTAAPTTEPTIEPTIAPTAAPGDFSARFDSLGMTTEETIVGSNKYLSDDICLRINEISTGRLTFYVADIWIRNIENLRTAFAKDTFGKGYREYAWDMCMENDGILAINGDYYGARDDGIVVRNGVLYRDTLYQDVCVLYRDGELATYSAEEFDLDAAMLSGVWQAWSFGPALLSPEGESVSECQRAVVNRNPRCGIGYYEPGHYCFVVVDGRSEESKGVTLAEFSLIFEELGCAVAYNLDGGNTASMTYQKRVVNEPSQGGRPVTDIILIAEVDGE